MTDVALPSGAMSDDFFHRARARLTLDVPAALNDPAAQAKRGENAAQRRLSQPFGIEAAPPLRHFVSPGTNCPSSIWAGT